MSTLLANQPIGKAMIVKAIDKMMWKISGFKGINTPNTKETWVKRHHLQFSTTISGCKLPIPGVPSPCRYAFCRDSCIWSACCQVEGVRKTLVELKYLLVLPEDRKKTWDAIWIFSYMPFGTNARAPCSKYLISWHQRRKCLRMLALLLAFCLHAHRFCLHIPCLTRTWR